MASHRFTRRALPAQDALFNPREIPTPPPAPAAIPELASYDIVLANISGGKDSQTMLRALVHAADAAGVRDRIVCVFADLGADDEWPGTAQIAAQHAAWYGLRLVTVCRMVADGHGGKRQQGLLEHIEHRGMWPDAQNRYCTVICTTPDSLIIDLRVEIKGGRSGSSPSVDGGPGGDPARRISRTGRPAESAVRAA